MNSHNKLTDYYFTAAKNDDAEFTHSELERVVESAEDNSRIEPNYFTKQKLRRIIMLSLLPLAGTIAATFLWLSAPTAPQASQKERTNTPANPAKQTSVPTPTLPVLK